MDDWTFHGKICIDKHGHVKHDVSRSSDAILCKHSATSFQVKCTHLGNKENGSNILLGFGRHESELKDPSQDNLIGVMFGGRKHGKWKGDKWYPCKTSSLDGGDVATFYHTESGLLEIMMERFKTGKIEYETLFIGITTKNAPWYPVVFLSHDASVQILNVKQNYALAT